MSMSKEHRGTIATVLSVICAIIVGIILKNFTQQPWSERDIMYLQFPGEIFLRIINGLILPLIVSSVISASCCLSKSGNIGLKALYYYTTTTILGITLSVILVEIIRPGEFYKSNVTSMSSRNFITADSILDILRNLFSDNIVNSCLSQYQTVLLLPHNTTQDISSWRISHQLNNGTNVLGLIGFSLLFGVAVGYLGDSGKPLVTFFKTLSEAITIMMNFMIKAVPVSVLFLIPGKLLQTDDIDVLISNLGIYALTVIVGLLIHSLIVLPLLYFICTKKSPIKILSEIGPAIITAIGTSSSTATVPVTIKCLDNIGVNPKVSRFIAPIGATINMDGIALYETIGAIFIIQQRGFDFSLTQVIALALVLFFILWFVQIVFLVVISITCTVSCIGAAGLPSGGYVMLMVVLESIGIPREDITLIITIDCFVDRLRTTVNIIADTFGAVLIDNFIKNDDNEHMKLDKIQRESLLVKN